MKNYLPILKLGKIVLREICEADALDYFEIGRDYETTKYLNWGPFVHPQDALWIIREVFFQRPKNGIPIGYAIVYEDKMVGVIDFHTYYAGANTAEIGYILHRGYWNRGIMKMCLRAVTEVGFRHLELDKILIGHTISNEASRHVILSCGYTYEYQRIVNMKEHEEIALYYAMYRYEFEGGFYYDF